jgi:hypothetical protein
MSEHSPNTSISSSWLRWPAAGNDHTRPKLCGCSLLSMPTHSLPRTIDRVHPAPPLPLPRSRALCRPTQILAPTGDSLKSP